MNKLGPALRRAELVELFRAEGRREFVVMRRYPLELASAVVLLIGVFFALLYGAKYLGIGAFAERSDVAIVGYGCWLLLVSGCSAMSSEVSSEATAGTLTNIFQSAYSPMAVFVVRSLVNALVSTGLVAATTCLMAMGASVDLHWSVRSLAAVATLIASATGMGLVVAGLVVVLKRTQFLLLPLPLVLLAMALTTFEDLPPTLYHAAWALPAVPSLVALRTELTGAGVLGTNVAAAAVANAVLFVALGIWSFRRLTSLARRRGSMAEY